MHRHLENDRIRDTNAVTQSRNIRVIKVPWAGAARPLTVPSVTEDCLKSTPNLILNSFPRATNKDPRELRLETHKDGAMS